MRYTIGQKLFGIHFAIDSCMGINKCLYNTPFFFNYDDVIERITIIPMTVKKHHKVAWEHDPAGEKKYDGYVLADDKNLVWHNQYPFASYGQVSTENNGFFTRPVTGDLLDHCIEQGKILECFLIGAFYDNMVRGIESIVKGPNTSRLLSKLQQLKEQIDTQLAEEYGMEMKAIPVTKELPTILQYVPVEIKPAASV